MKKPSIYPDRSQELLALFERAGNNKKVMCVPIDYAKKDHLVMFCNGYGEVLRKPFSVDNSVDGWSKAGALDKAFSKDNSLGQWRYIVQELYGIKLKL